MYKFANPSLKPGKLCLHRLLGQASGRVPPAIARGGQSYGGFGFGDGGDGRILRRWAHFEDGSVAREENLIPFEYEDSMTTTAIWLEALRDDRSISRDKSSLTRTEPRLTGEVSATLRVPATGSDRWEIEVEGVVVARVNEPEHDVALHELAQCLRGKSREAAA